MVQNKAVIFKSVPNGFPVPGKDLTVEASEFDLEQQLPENAFIVKVTDVSFDPYQRGRMRPAEVKSYSPAFTLGGPIANSSIGLVVKTNNPNFKEGDIVKGMFPTQEYALIAHKDLIASTSKIENPHGLDLKVFLGPLGMPGLTAYSSFYAIGQPKKGETIFVSAASGAVGQLVGQLAKHEGLTVIGSVGSDDKLEFITKELGFDGGFNYKKEKPLDALKRLAPNGIDIYYENVGGEQLEAAINHLNVRGRIIACGMISGYSQKPEEQYPIRNLMQVIAKRLTIRGFIVGDEDMGPVYAKEHTENVSKWIKEGSFKYKLSVTEGIENGPEGFVGMLSGKNFGKAILEIAKN